MKIDLVQKIKDRLNKTGFKYHSTDYDGSMFIFLDSVKEASNAENIILLEFQLEVERFGTQLTVSI